VNDLAADHREDAARPFHRHAATEPFFFAALETCRRNAMEWGIIQNSAI
jgi:hypothetical protein